MFVKTIIALSLAILAIAAPQAGDDFECMSILYLNSCSCTNLTNRTQLVTRCKTLIVLLTILTGYMWGGAGPAGANEGIRLVRFRLVR